jgi:hypothetical protein
MLTKSWIFCQRLYSMNRTDFPTLIAGNPRVLGVFNTSTHTLVSRYPYSKPLRVPYTLDLHYFPVSKPTHRYPRYSRDPEPQPHQSQKASPQGPRTLRTLIHPRPQRTTACPTFTPLANSITPSHSVPVSISRDGNTPCGQSCSGSHSMTASCSTPVKPSSGHPMSRP